MKKLTVLLLGSAASLPAFANQPQAFTGTSVGMEVGTTRYKFDKDWPRTKSSTDISLSASHAFEFGNSQLIGEVEGKIKPIATTIAKQDGVRIKEKSRYSVSYLQGYRSGSDVMPYAKIGYNESRFENKDNSQKAKARGYSVGFGAKYAVAPHLEMGVEYTHTRLKSVKKASDGSRPTLRGNGLSTSIAYRF